MSATALSDPRHNVTQSVTDVAMTRRGSLALHRSHRLARESSPRGAHFGPASTRPASDRRVYWILMSDPDYFDSLIRRKRVGLWYRNAWLYPRICRHLRGQVLDVGCGIGDMVSYRAQTIGVDINPKAVAYCRSRGLIVEQMQSDRLPFPDGAFEGAVLDNVLEHLEKPEQLLAEVRRVVRTGGSFVVGVPGEGGYASDPDHKHHYPETTLIRCVESSGFQVSTVFHQPFRSRLLDRRFRYYAIYGVFRRR